MATTPKNSNSGPPAASAPTVADLRRRRWARWRAATVVVGSGVIWLVLLLLPVDFFDHHGPTLCISRLLLDRECPGCGMTRASMHALHLDFAGAWHYNRLVVIVLPLLAYLWAKEVWDQSRRLGWIKR